MVRLWDYLMRRKGILSSFALVFVLSGLLTLGVMRQLQVKISLGQGIEIPRTGELNETIPLTRFCDIPCLDCNAGAGMNVD